MPDSRPESRLALNSPPPYHPPPFRESKSFAMLQWMHRLSTSWVASLFMGVLALSFVVWGIADVFTGMTTTALVTVGSTEISQDAFSRSYRNFLRTESQREGTNITPDMAQKMGLGNVALQQLVSRTALDNTIRRMGLTTSDAALAASVRATPAFHGPTGEFDKNTFNQIIGNAGYNEPDFLAEMRADLTRDQLSGSLERGFSLPTGYVQALFLFLTEKRAADYVIVAPEAVGPIAPPGDAVLAAYVKQHADQFSTPEYRQVEYAQIGPQDVAKEAAVTDAMIAADFAAHQADYNVPEKRDIQQIEFASQAEAEAARAALDKGKSFDALAADKKIKPADLSLGTLTRDMLADPLRADAAFSLPVGQVSPPVKTALGGYVLLKVTKITPGSSRTLDQAKDEIRKRLALGVAAGKIADILNAFEDARSGGADIPTAARKAGMKSGKLAAIDKNGVAPDGTQPFGLPADAEFFTQAFAAEPDQDTDPFAAKSGENYAIKVDAVMPPKLKPLDQVRTAALAVWTQEQRQSALERKAAELAARATIDNSLANIAKQMKVPVQQSPALARNTSDTTFSSALVTKIFNAAPGAVVEAPQAVGPNFIIARVTGVSHSAPAGQEFEGGRAQLSQEAASDISVSFANAARLREGVKVNQQMLQSALGQQ
jgi:peptidyl-prolyl cis-trans isomerase D